MVEGGIEAARGCHRVEGIIMDIEVDGDGTGAIQEDIEVVGMARPRWI